MKALPSIEILIVFAMLLTLASCGNEAPMGGVVEVPANSPAARPDSQTEIPAEMEDESSQENSNPPPIAAQPPTPAPPSPSPSMTISSDVFPAPRLPDRKFLTADEARAICSAWLDNQTALPAYTIIDHVDIFMGETYPPICFFGDLYYYFEVDGVFDFRFAILVHVETGEALFRTSTLETGNALFGTSTNGEHITVTVGLLDDWHYRERGAAYTPMLSIDEALGFHDSWINNRADGEYTLGSLKRSTNETYELFGERYYLFRDEGYTYWNNILVHMETGELLIMLIEDGASPAISFKQLELFDLSSWRCDLCRDFIDMRYYEYLARQ